MPVGVADEFRADAERAENDQDVFDFCHVHITRFLEVRGRAYQEMPYFAAIRRAFASSP
jgi:hypothetical protein